MGADIYDWDRVHGKGSYAAMADGQPTVDDIRERMRLPQIVHDTYQAWRMEQPAPHPVAAEREWDLPLSRWDLYDRVVNAVVAAEQERAEQGLAAAIAAAVVAERERIRQLADRNGAVCTGDEGTQCWFSDLLGEMPS
jgi:hypothetical protein